MFDHLLESCHRDDSNKWSNIEFGEEITQVHVESIEVNLRTLSGALDQVMKNAEDRTLELVEIDP